MATHSSAISHVRIFVYALAEGVKTPWDCKHPLCSHRCRRLDCHRRPMLPIISSRWRPCHDDKTGYRVHDASTRGRGGNCSAETGHVGAVRLGARRVDSMS